jgi:hypothetical protein
LRVPAPFRKYRLTEANSNGDGNGKKRKLLKVTGKSEDKADGDRYESKRASEFLSERSLFETVIL